jgi:hypothetical protein
VLATAHRLIATTTNLAAALGTHKCGGTSGCAGHLSRENKSKMRGAKRCHAIPFSHVENKLKHAARMTDVATGKLRHNNHIHEK